MLTWQQANIVKTLTTQKNQSNMPTVKYKCGDTGKTKTKTFPYNAVGKAQSTEFAKTMGGSVKNNPGYGMEKKMESSY